MEVFALKHLSMAKENKSLAEIIQMELRQSHKLIKEYRKTIFSEYVDIISAIIRQGQARGIFRKDVKPGIAKRAFFGALDEMTRLWVLSPKPPYDIEDTAKQISNMFLDLYERGIKEQNWLRFHVSEKFVNRVSRFTRCIIKRPNQRIELFT